MIINSAALQRKSAVIVLLVFIVLAGFSCYYSLPRENSPDVTIPYIFVSTSYEGVAPEDMEKLVTIPLERKLKGLADLKELSSISDDGVSLIRCEFDPGIDIDDALQKVRDKVDQAKADLPSDLPDDPEINEVNLSEQPILNVILSGPYSLKRLKVFAESLEDKIESIQGVLDAEIVGGLEREIHVLFDMDRVAYYRMPLNSMLSSVESGNVNMPGGSMDIGTAKYTVRVPEEFQHPSEIENIVAYVRDGKPVYLRDVAYIKDHYKDPTDRSRFNGQPSVTISVKKRSGENIIQINDEVRAKLAALEDQLPPNLKIDLTSDRSVDIRRMVADLENNIISGLILVLVVVFAFIGGRSALFVSLSIPISMLITFIALSALGITLNMVVLFSLILALGMLVDNGIVVVENIYRHMQDGKTREQAAQAATDEVAWPVITSTLTTVGAFFPMVFWPGIMGEFMSYLPKTVIIALAGSLFVALVVNPVLSSRFQNIRKSDLEGRPTRVDRFLERLKEAYLPLLEWSLENRFKTLGFAFAMLVLSVAAFGVFGNGVIFMPETDPQRAWIKVKAPVGTNLDTSDALVMKVEKVCEEYDDIKYTITKVGATNSSDEVGTHYSLVTVEFPDIHDRSRPSSELITEIRQRLNKTITGAEIMVDKEKHGPSTGAPVNLEISGEDIHVLGSLAWDIRKRIKNIPGLVDLKDDYVKSKPEITVNVDKEKAALLGLDTRTIATTVKSAINGSKVGTYREGKDEYDIVAKLPEKDRQSVESLRRITVSGSDGQPVPITSLAEISLGSGLGGIERIDQKRVVTISGEVDGRNAGEILRDIQEILKEVQMPRGYTISFTGQQEEQDDASSFLGKAFVATIFIIFLVLVTQFNSVVTPFIILTSVLLSLIGVFLGLVITGTSFSVIMTGVGVISLAGVVVNNAIVLIDYYEQLVREGLEARAAIIKAGLTRFRPVLLTAITTVLGLLPMATGISFDFMNFRWDIGGESSQWWGPMAVAVIFGLAVATMLTLVVVPVLCSLKATYLDSRKQQA